jgi:hypothetical protein
MSANDAFTETLNIMRGPEELFDQADAMDLARWHQIDLENEREEMTEKALNECLQAGVSTESLRWLAKETGAVRWALQNSLRKE